MLRRWLAFGLGAVGIAAALAGGLQWSERPATYRDAVVELLDQRRIAHAGVEVREVCRPDPRCIVGDSRRTFATVVVYRAAASYGQITCYDRRGDCYLDLMALDIIHVPLRDLRGMRRLPKPLALLAEEIAARLRAVIRRGQP